jgi:clorobiocin biosynthesis protein CloN6
VDYVIRGYDTLLPVELLIKAQGSPDALAQVPNLTWMRDGEVQVNAMTHVPQSYDVAVDWSQVFSREHAGMTPYNLVIPQAGCEYDCTWCGGSRYFYDQRMCVKQRAQKTPAVLRTELESIVKAKTAGHTVTMIDFWHEYPQLFDVASDVLQADTVRSVHYSLNRLPTVEKARRMAAPARAILELSPDSHDLEIARAGGRAKYTMQEMEEFIDALLGDVYAFEIYYLIGLPGQTAASVWETVDYCEHLLSKYAGQRVTPFLCPMLPFLDPGSQIFERPDEWEYTIFHRTLEDHRTALLSTSWKHRLNYETRWLSRDELVDISYSAVRALTLLKQKHGVLPRGIANSVIALIDETRGLLAEIDAHREMPPGECADQVGRDLGRRIREYNGRQFEMVRSQQRPVDFGFARRQWFDTDWAFDEVLADESQTNAGHDPKEIG